MLGAMPLNKNNKRGFPVDGKLSAKLRKKLLFEYSEFRKEIPLPVYVLWWPVRAAMIYVLIRVFQQDSHLKLQIAVNTALCFALPAFHLLPRGRCFLARLSFRAQNLALPMILLTAVFGMYLGVYSYRAYDLFVHFAGCFICVFAGAQLTVALERERTRITPLVLTLCGFGLSFFTAVGWEIFEFLYDQFSGMNIQYWEYTPSEKFLELFPTDPRRFALLDTMTDLITGTVGSIAGGLVLLPLLKRRERRSAVPNP